MTVINIGLAREGQENLDPWVAYDMLKKTGAWVSFATVVSSDSEPTLVAELRTVPSNAKLFELSEILEQDCVALWDGARGELIGPRADKWEPFNPHYFMLVDGSRLN